MATLNFYTMATKTKKARKPQPRISTTQTAQVETTTKSKAVATVFNGSEHVNPNAASSTKGKKFNGSEWL